jgi:lysophospholipase L1-like esterase
MPAGRTFIVIAVCLLVWTLLYAPELRRSAEAAPVGTRRTVSMTLLAPLVWISDHVGLTSVTDAASRAAGRDPNAAVGGVIGGVQVGVDELPEPPASPKPTKPVKHDTRMREPTFDHQLRVAVVGDSLAAGIGYFAERVFKPFFVEVYKQGRISMAWRAGLLQLACADAADRRASGPDLVLVMLGENDNQGLLNWDGSLEQDIGTFDWAALRRSVERFAKTAAAGGARVVDRLAERARPWTVGLHPEAECHLRGGRRPAAQRRVLRHLGRVRGPRRRVQRLLPGRGPVTQVRADDGVHFNTDGYTADAEGRRVQTEAFQLDPKTYGTDPPPAS